MAIEVKLLVGRHINLALPMQIAAPVPLQAPVPAGFQQMQPQILHINESNFLSRIAGPRTSTIGAGAHATKAHRTFQWLAWVGGSVSEIPLNGTDVLTGPMSGCWITRYTRGGVLFVGHVGTVAGHADPLSVAAKGAWNNFIVAAPAAAATGFNPFNDFVPPYPAMVHGQDGAPKVFALVTAAGQFYSVFTYPLLATPNMVRIAAIQGPLPNTLPQPIP